MSEVEYVTINGHHYELKLENSGADPEWPWFVNAYEVGVEFMGWRSPARFCAGKSKADAIERVTRGIKGLKGEQ